MFEVQFENLGSVKAGQMKLNKLTILCGANGTGKTYASYATYGLLKRFPMQGGISHSLEATGKVTTQVEIDLLDELDNIITTWNEQYSASLYTVFSTHQSLFENSKVAAIIHKESLKQDIASQAIQIEYEASSGNDDTDSFHFRIEKKAGESKATVTYSDVAEEDEEFFNHLLVRELHKRVFRALESQVFLLPAERAGLNLFFQELNATRNEFLQKMRVELINQREPINSLQSIAAYPAPVSDYLTFLNRLEKLSLSGETSYKHLAAEIQEKIIKGTYSVENQSLFFIPTDSDAEQTPKIHLHVSSSTSKTLFGLVFYLQYMARDGQYLIIDEPELNLHPDNQRKLARILAKVANQGVNVIISTHSDHIIREYNNLLMLSNDFPSRQKLMEKYNYSEDEILHKEDVSPYVFVDGTIHPMEIDEKEGIIAETFDNVINQYNQSVDDIFYTMQGELDGE